MLKYMLDTDTVIHTLKNRPAEIKAAFEKHYNQMCISTITLMELVHGAENSSAPEQNRRDVYEFASRLEVLDYGSEAAGHTGQIRAEAPNLGLCEQMVAGHARSRGLVLVTTRKDDFGAVPGLRLDDWSA